MIYINSYLGALLKTRETLKCLPWLRVYITSHIGLFTNTVFSPFRLSSPSPTDSSRSPTPALSYSNIVNQASHNPSSPSSSYPTATGSGVNHGNTADDNDSATDSNDSQDSIIHVTGPYRGPAAAGYIQQQKQQQQQQQKKSKMAANASSDGVASTTVWSPFGQLLLLRVLPPSHNS